MFDELIQQMSPPFLKFQRLTILQVIALHYNLRLRFILLEIFAKYFLLIRKIIISFSSSDMLWYFCNECEIKENGKMKAILNKE